MMTMANRPESTLERNDSLASWGIVTVVKVIALNLRVQIFPLQLNLEKINLFKSHL